jgi:hypothetical protein
MKRLLPPTALASLLVVALAGPARADFLWHYSTTPLTPTVSATTGSGTITLSGEGTASALGSTPIVIAGLTAQSTAVPGHEDSFVNAPWQVSVSITDGGHTGSLTISGVFNGKLSSGGTDPGFSSHFTGASPDSIQLNGHSYTVTAGGFVPPTVPGGLDSGGLGLQVDVQASTTSTTPEPSTLLLCGLGAAGCALAGWRRSRQRPVLTA